MKNKTRILTMAFILIATLSLAACDATGAVSINELTGGAVSNDASLNNSPSKEAAYPTDTPSDDDSSAEIKLKGMVEAVTENSVTINGETFVIDTPEDLASLFMVGMAYELEYTLNADGSISLMQLSLEDMSDDEEMEFKGVVDEVTEDTLTFGGETYLVGTDEDLTTLFTAGETYEIEYYLNPDGSITLKDYSLEDDMGDDSSDDIYDDSSDDDMYDDNNDDSYNDNENNDSYNDSSDDSSNENNSSNNEHENNNDSENND